MVHKRYKLSRLFGTNCVSELFFVSFFSFGLLPPAPKRRLRGEPATVNWGILEAMGSSVMSTFVCRHKGKSTLFWVLLVPILPSTPLGQFSSFFAAKYVSFVFGTQLCQMISLILKIGYDDIFSGDIGPLNS